MLVQRAGIALPLSDHVDIEAVDNLALPILHDAPGFDGAVEIVFDIRFGTCLRIIIERRGAAAVKHDQSSHDSDGFQDFHCQLRGWT